MGLCIFGRLGNLKPWRGSFGWMIPRPQGHPLCVAQLQSAFCLQHHPTVWWFNMVYIDVKNYPMLFERLRQHSTSDSQKPNKPKIMYSAQCLPDHEKGHHHDKHTPKPAFGISSIRTTHPHPNNRQSTYCLNGSLYFHSMYE